MDDRCRNAKRTRGVVRGLNLVVCLLVLGGCGPHRPETAPVSGVVLLDGKPLAKAQVMFVLADGGRPALGETDAEGQYQLSTFEDGDGALVGRHGVAITANKISKPPLGSDGLPLPLNKVAIEWFAPERYSRVDSSGLNAEVQRGHNTFDFQLTSRHQ